MTDTAIAIILLATVALVAALWWFIWRHKERKPLAVIAINSLYRLSQIVYALAYAADCAYVTYQRTLRDIAADHRPKHAEVEG